MEDKCLRQWKRQLPGLSIYVMIFRNFRNDERLAKAQALEELQQISYRPNLNDFITRWDRSIEAFTSAGDLSSDDEIFLYTLFKKNFLAAK